jgi:hypothetical protein
LHSKQISGLFELQQPASTAQVGTAPGTRGKLCQLQTSTVAGLMLHMGVVYASYPDDQASPAFIIAHQLWTYKQKCKSLPEVAEKYNSSIKLLSQHFFSSTLSM